jgi:hypothetical protein
MGYSNNFKLTVEGKLTKEVLVKECQCGNQSEDLSQNFCGKCGSPLTEKEVQKDINSYDIISEFVQEYEDGDAGFLLEEDGDTRESGSGYGLNKEVGLFSKKYPELIFILSCQWESGLVSEGVPGTDYFFFKNGVEKKAKSKVIYINPFTSESFAFKN